MGETVAEQMKAVIRKEAAEPAEWRGPDWWQLSEAEEYVFAIEADRFPLMIMTLHAYEAFAGMSQGAPMDMDNEALFEALKAARPDIVAQGWSLAGFFNFVTSFSEISPQEAWKVYSKNEAWQVREAGLVFSEDKAAPTN
jgi:hypothetical protein